MTSVANALVLASVAALLTALGAGLVVLGALVVNALLGRSAVAPMMRTAVA